MQSYLDNSASIRDTVGVEEPIVNRYKSQGGACSANSGEFCHTGMQSLYFQISLIFVFAFAFQINQKSRLFHEAYRFLKIGLFLFLKMLRWLNKTDMLMDSA